MALVPAYAPVSTSMRARQYQHTRPSVPSHASRHYQPCKELRSHQYQSRIVAMRPSSSSLIASECLALTYRLIALTHRGIELTYPLRKRVTHLATCRASSSDSFAVAPP
eukprot:3739223-Rhodomonas_salina.1